MAEKRRLAAPLCSTCTYHETQSTRINVMWGAGKVMLGIIPIVATILITILYGIAADVEQNASRIREHETKMTGSLHRLERVIDTISMNQIKHMQEDGIEYIVPNKELHLKDL